ncbi:PrgI family protein [Candidatus Wolfebacteria bacterium]|nr:PrgI family protein [Candidatus Wolfebacteria bacterium]
MRSMRFQVPQFIEVEDKVIGPLTFKQFVYLAGGAGLAFLLYTFLPVLIALPLMAVAAGLAIALAFYKYNNKPFIDVLAAFFQYFTTSRLYIWKKEPKKPDAGKVGAATQDALYVPKLSDSKLKDLAWSLDVHDQTNEQK